MFAISCRPFFTFSIDNHNITFMEADGIEHDPVEVQNVDVYAGEEISPFYTSCHSFMTFE